jgi:hypothetical protein
MPIGSFDSSVHRWIAVHDRQRIEERVAAHDGAEDVAVDHGGGCAGGEREVRVGTAVGVSKVDSLAGPDRLPGGIDRARVAESLLHLVAREERRRRAQPRAGPKRQ